MEFGLELFPLRNASWNLRPTEAQHWEFTFAVECGEGSRLDSNGKVIAAKPQFEVTVVLSPDELHLSPGRVLVLESGFDQERYCHLSNFYYYGHESVDSFRAVISRVTEDLMDAEMTGITVVAGSGPDAFALRTNFKRDMNLKRGIN